MKKRHPNIHNEILMEKKVRLIYIPRLPFKVFSLSWLSLQVLQRFDHPHIVTLYSTFQDYGTLYYQMEYVHGSDLWSLLHDHVYDAKTGIFQCVSLARNFFLNPYHCVFSDTYTLTEQVGLHWSCIVGYFSQIVSAVEHMHQHGVVHRDLKPENVMVAHNGQVGGAFRATAISV